MIAQYSLVLNQAGVPNHIRQSPGGRVNLQLCCPFCVERGETPDRRFRLGVSPSGLGHCFNCGWKSRKAWRAVFRAFRIADMPTLTATGEQDNSEAAVVAIPIGCEPLWREQPSELAMMALEYLGRRGVTSAQICRYRFGAVFEGKYAYRVIVPGWRTGELVCLIARDITERQRPKYLSEGDKVLWGAPRRFTTIHLFEGVFKALRARQAVPQMVVGATLGSQLTEAQLEQLAEAGCRRVVLWPDPDRPGAQGADRSCRLLEDAGLQVGVVQTSEPTDELPLTAIAESAKTVKKFGWLQSLKLALYDG